MNKYKLLFGSLLICGILSYGVIYADTMNKNYVGIEINAYKTYTNIATELKIDRTVGQSYYNAGNINTCTGNENGIVAKLLLITQNVGELTISSGNTTKSWPNTDGVKDGTRYNLKIKNNTFSPCKSSHSGTWYHN